MIAIIYNIDFGSTNNERIRIAQLRAHEIENHNQARSAEARQSRTNAAYVTVSSLLITS